MDNMENMGNPNMEPETNTMQEPEKSSVGAMVGIVIVIALLVAGAFYFYGRENTVEDAPQNIETIEEDLEGIDYDTLDAEFNESLDAEL